jgi:hypothetical protein
MTGMGERVYVKTVRAQPIGSGGGGAETVRDDGVRLDYAKRDVNPIFPTFWKAVAWVRYVGDELIAALRPRLTAAAAAGATLVQKLGGGRQLAFAFGMMCLAGGLGAALSPRDGAPAFWMAIGGMIVGLTLRLSSPPASKG